MKTTVTIALILSVILNITLIYIFVYKGEITTSTDNRTELQMSDANRDFVLLEMRDFLESVQQINEGILNNNPELVIKAAAHSGGAVIAHTPQGLLKSLPIGFKDLGFATHAIFDEIEANAKQDFDPIKTQKQLNDLLNNCTACHQSFKISTIPLK